MPPELVTIMHSEDLAHIELGERLIRVASSSNKVLMNVWLREATNYRQTYLCRSWPGWIRNGTHVCLCERESGQCGSKNADGEDPTLFYFERLQKGGLWESCLKTYEVDLGKLIYA